MLQPARVNLRPLHIGLVLIGLLAINVVVWPTRPIEPHDWVTYEQLPGRLAAGTLYEIPWAWTPLAAWIMAGLVPIGYTAWTAVHLTVLLLLRNWRVILLALVSVPFWLDTLLGHTTIFVFVAGWAALRGSRLGTLASIALFLLAPRPVQAPLIAWLIWRQRDMRLPFAGMAVVVLALTLASGYAGDWIATTAGLTQRYLDDPANYSPTRWLGLAWLLVGIPLGAWSAWRGRVGLAGLAIAPYVLPQYPLLLLWDLREWLGPPVRRTPVTYPSPVPPEEGAGWDRSAELESITADYARYQLTGRYNLWDERSPGYARLSRSLQAHMVDALRRSVPAEGARVLDLGCGTGDLLQAAGALNIRAGWTGLDLRPQAIETARANHPATRFIVAPADEVPLDDASQDAIVARVLFSSLPSAEMEAAVAAEVHRLLRPGGWLVWLDIRYSNPRNPSVHGISKRRLERLFPGWRHEIETAGLLPPIARRLGPLTPVAYRALSAIGPLRSHLVGRVGKPIESNGS